MNRGPQQSFFPLQPARCGICGIALLKAVMPPNPFLDILPDTDPHCAKCNAISVKLCPAIGEAFTEFRPKLYRTLLRAGSAAG